MLIERIKNDAKSKNVKVFFDMDGVLVEYRILSEQDFLTVSFCDNLRPLKHCLKFAKKLTKIKNVDVCILSNCRTKQHKQDKLDWLEKYAPFIKKENINIICYEEILDFYKFDKCKVKANLILKMKKDKDFVAYHIDDDTTIIKYEKDIKEINIVHVSRII